MTTSIDDLLDTGRLDEASRRLSEQLQKGSASADVLVAQGRLLGAQRDLEGALQSLEEALRLDPSHARARGYRGVLLYEMGRQGEARPDLMAAAEQGITDGAIHFALAQFGRSRRSPALR